jgi:hypothetical protein
MTLRHRHGLAGALLGLAASPLACTDDGASIADLPPQPDPPELLSANFEVGGGRLVLRFSETVVVPADIDPANFRLSLARLEYDAPTEYEPPVYDLRVYDPNYYAAGTEVTVVAVAGGELPEEVLLTLDPPAASGLCVAVEALDEFSDGDEVGLLIHYDSGSDPDAPRLRGLDDEAVGDLGREWARADATSLAGVDAAPLWAYVDSALGTELEIPCSF